MPHIEEWHCVYIIGCNELVPIKVGRTANIMSRLDGMQTGCPYQLKLHDAFFAPKNVITWLEWDAHRKLHDFGFGVRDGLRSEWFDIDPKEAADVVKKCAEIEGFEICDVRRFAAMAREQKGKSPPEWIDRIEAIGFMVYGVLGAQ